MEKITTKEIQAIISKGEMLLLSTHAKLCLPVINKIYLKMKAGVPVPSIKVCNNLICDGHHRYVASLLAKVALEEEHGYITSATIVTPWEEVMFEADDWDVHRKVEIDRFNQQDAEYLQIEVHELLEMLN